jgi:Plavaka transposase
MHGVALPPGTAPPHEQMRPDGDWSPFGSKVEFNLAELLFSKAEMSCSDIDRLMDIWAQYDGLQAPFFDYKDLYSTIDSISLGGVPWSHFQVKYSGNLPEEPVPAWMTMPYDVYYRDPRRVIHDILANKDFRNEFDYKPFREFVNEKRRWMNFMSGNWAWKQAVPIYSNTLINI